MINGQFPKRSNIQTKKLRSFLLKQNLVIKKENYIHLFFQYSRYFYRLLIYCSAPLFSIAFTIFKPINFLLIGVENILKKIFKYHCDIYMFVLNKK